MRKILTLILLLFINISILPASPSTTDDQSSLGILLADSAGVTWRCKRCGYYNYSETQDWKGDYFCLRCKTRKGDE